MMMKKKKKKKMMVKKKGEEAYIERKDDEKKGAINYRVDWDVKSNMNRPTCKHGTYMHP